MWRRVWALTFFVRSEGQAWAAARMWWLMRRSTASRLSGRPVLVGNSGSVGLPVAFGQPDAQDRDGQGQQRGVPFSCGPCPGSARALRRPRTTSAQVRPVSSETRSPVWTASTIRAWSRRPVQVDRSQAASRASISVVGEEGDQVAFEPLGRDGQHPLDRRGVLGMVQRGVAEQRVDRGQAGVAGAHSVAALGFQVSQERPDQRGVQVGEVQLAGLGVRVRSAGEAQQQPEGVAVAGDGVRAGLALADEPVGEKRLQGGRQLAHRRAP